MAVRVLQLPWSILSFCFAVIIPPIMLIFKPDICMLYGRITHHITHKKVVKQSTQSIEKQAVFLWNCDQLLTNKSVKKRIIGILALCIEGGYSSY